MHLCHCSPLLVPLASLSIIVHKMMATDFVPLKPAAVVQVQTCSFTAHSDWQAKHLKFCRIVYLSKLRTVLSYIPPHVTYYWSSEASRGKKSVFFIAVSVAPTNYPLCCHSICSIQQWMVDASLTCSELCVESCRRWRKSKTPQSAGQDSKLSAELCSLPQQAYCVSPFSLTFSMVSPMLSTPWPLQILLPDRRWLTLTLTVGSVGPQIEGRRTMKHPASTTSIFQLPGGHIQGGCVSPS